MRDISYKTTTKRTAIARAVLIASAETIQRVRRADVPKGDPLPIAKVAAIQAAKKTTEWIPYCHNIPIEHVAVDFELQADRILVDVVVISIARTGVEMEAITAAAAAVISLYDMLKMIDDDMVIDQIRLLEKHGGKSDLPRADGWTAGVIVASDRVSAGAAEDASGRLLVEGLQSHGAVSVHEIVVPDEMQAIRRATEEMIDGGLDFVIVTGGTGISPRDVTPEALEPLIQTHLPGVVSALLTYGQSRTPTAMLSRPVAGISSRSIIISMPGSPGAVADCLAALFPAILHAREMLVGGGHP